MGIEDLGDQLVKEKEERAKQIQKRMKREQTALAIAQVGIPVAGRIIEENLVQKSMDFFNSENVMNLTREYNKAATHAAGVINTEQQIQQSGGDAFAYFSDKNFEAAKAQVMDVLTLEQEGGREALAQDEIILRARGIADDMAENQSREHAKSLNVAVNLGTREEFNSELARQLRPTTPQNIVDAVGRKVSTFFGGRSTQERQVDAINVFKNGYQFDNTQQMQGAIEEYKKTNNWRSAFTKAANTAEGSEGQGYWADKIRELRGMKKYEMPLQTQIKVITLPNGDRVLDGYTFTNNADGSMNQESIKAFKELKLGTDPQAASLYDMQFDRNLKDIFDPRKTAEKYLTQDGVKVYEELLNSKDLTSWDFSGAAEHQALYQTFKDFIASDEGQKYIIPEYTQSQLYRQRELFVSDWYGDILAELDEAESRQIRSAFSEEFEGVQKFLSESARGEESTPPALSSEFITAYGEGDEAKARQKLREAVVAWENKLFADDEIFNGDRASLNISSDFQVKEVETGNDEPNVPPTPVTVPEELAGQRVATLDWPDEYQNLLDKRDKLNEETPSGPQAISSLSEQKRNINNQIASYQDDLEKQIQVAQNRVDNTSPDGIFAAGTSETVLQQNIDELERLKAQRSQFIAMQDSIDSTILPAGGAD
tara:strand:- start:5404 stop:7368 length:1965 start_codon:yes stop_codon:yes gene_type:complete